ncbi:metallophosphoesterase [Sutterella sp.]|uniref:metallophosphoesterase n=1 Tax=Sutterella sp. TaxID=1981025 RepID=UPI0026DEC3F4|nr:metallophosphoesterase [Sutterella sp.]MDO5531221.1 metallophosphoesterase [Sutterella sp.]
MRMMFVMLGVYIALNAWVCWLVVRSLAGLPLVVRILAGLLFLALAFAFPLFEFAHRRIPMSLTQAGYWIATGWPTFVFYTAIAYAVLWLLCRLGLPLLDAVPWARIATAAGLAAAVLICGYVNFTIPAVREITVDLSAGAANPRTIRVAAVSDLHLGYGITRERLEGWVRRINEGAPEAVLVSGDLIDMAMRPLDETQMDEALRGLRAPKGVWMAPGNHEHYSGLAGAADFAKRSNIRLLIDEAEELAPGLTIVGRDDRRNPARSAPAALLDRVPEGNAVVVLDHQPHAVDVERTAAAAPAGRTFAFYGHTHDGQVWPFNHVLGLFGLLPTGMNKVGGIDAFVSSGLGLWGGPFRVATTGEILFITIRW